MIPANDSLQGHRQPPENWMMLRKLSVLNGAHPTQRIVQYEVPSLYLFQGKLTSRLNRLCIIQAFIYNYLTAVDTLMR